MRLVLLLTALLTLTGCGPLDYYSGRNMGFYHSGLMVVGVIEG